MNSSILLMVILGIGAIAATFFALKSPDTKNHSH